jgi:gamma-glutamylcyclotransferase (GGCT)/AIG2-like uncharacterized protein YtfP
MIRIFAYGSLMNPRSLHKVVPGERAFTPATLRNYRRKCNAADEGRPYLAMNIVFAEGYSVEGYVLDFYEHEFSAILERERGYAQVNVAHLLTQKSKVSVYAFVAPDKPQTTGIVPRSYLLTCMMGIPREKRENWLADTLIECDILEDLDTPVYANHAFD